MVTIKTQQNLVIAGNKLSQTTIPSLHNLKELEELDLSNNDLTELPEGICSLRHLRRLSVNGNTLPHSAIVKIFNTFTNLESLEMSCFGIGEFPREISNLTHLKQLKLSNNHSQETISFICQALPNLEGLFLAVGYLTELPPAISNLNIRQLSLTDNHLTESAIANIGDWSLPNLEELDLSNNFLSELPPKMGTLRHLKRLKLSDNHLTQAAIENLCNWTPNLETLDLSYNGLTELPPAIGMLYTTLKVLCLNDNLTPVSKENIKQWLPHTQILF